MAALTIFIVLAFSTVLSIIEIPKMLKNKLYKDLVAFSVLLSLGTVLVILKALGVEIPNPSDWVAWIYSPVSGLFKNIFN